MDWHQQLSRYKDEYGPGVLPRVLLWRVPPVSLRGTGKFPPLSAHVSTISAIVNLYPGNLAPKLVYYPDVEAPYASLWASTSAEKAEITADPTLAVHQYLPKDIETWNVALKAAGLAPFSELILEVAGAPLAPAVGGDLVSPTMLMLRENVLLEGIALSLTPDFSVTGGRCKSNIADDCSLFVGNRTGGAEWPAGTYYTQMYNIYEELTSSVKPQNTSVVKTDVTPWAVTSPGSRCDVIKAEAACASSCCEWSNDGHVCQPRVNSSHIYNFGSRTLCLLPDPGLCVSNSIGGCQPQVGGSIYTKEYSPTAAADVVAGILAQRIGTRCHNGGSGIEVLNATTFWQTFTLIFSYEPWSAPGPPLYLMGNPDYTYDNSMWSEFIFSFKRSLAKKLASEYPTTLCQDLAATVEDMAQVGVYWARGAIAAWNQTKSNN